MENCLKHFAPIAQLDRAPAYGAGCCWFDPSWAHKITKMAKKMYNLKTMQDMSKLVLQELKEDPFYKFKLVFALMSVIPLLTCFYVFIGSGLDITKISFVLYILIFISLLGFLLGFNTIKNLLNKVIFYTIEIKRSEQLKAELAASVSHDFKIPIKIIEELLGLVVSGSSGPINDRQKSHLHACGSTLGNMSQTIETLLDLYKIKAGLVDLAKEPCNLAELLKEKIVEFGVLLEKNKIALSKKIAEKDLWVKVDKEKIKEVINNILSNTMKYTPQSGWVSIHAFISGEFIRVEFANDSENIPVDKLGEIFEKFKRLDYVNEGTGLGLAIAKDIVELHGGEIWAENILNKGVKFVMVLPRN